MSRSELFWNKTLRNIARKSKTGSIGSDGARPLLRAPWLIRTTSIALFCTRYPLSRTRAVTAAAKDIIGGGDPIPTGCSPGEMA